jgi:PHD/YefM family antitoxin component YafN of YafNO toxin-antitoxin module
MKSAFAEREVITRKGKPVSVIIPIKEYEALLERLEDAEDLAYLKEARARPLSFRPLKEYLAERKKSCV